MTDKPKKPDDQNSADQPPAPSEIDGTPSAEAGAGEQAKVEPSAGEDAGQAASDPQSSAPEANAAEATGAAGESAADENAEPKSGETPKRRHRHGDRRRRTGSWASFFLFLILLGGLGGLGYYHWSEQQRVEQELAELNEQLDEQLGAQASRIEDLDRSVSAAQQQAQQTLQEASQLAEQSQQQSRRMAQQLEQQINNQVQEQVGQLERQLGLVREQLQAISTTTTEDWKLAEAYYLTRLAGQRLLMERDTESSMALLQAADNIVRNYPDPDLHEVRSALADDIAELRLANDVDRQGIYLQIESLSRQLGQLQVAEPLNYEADNQADNGEQSENAAEADNGGVWASIRQSFNNALNRLSDFIRVSHHEQAPQPLMSPDRQLYLRSSLQTTLDTAQLALMREQSEIYQTSLQKAENLLTELYVEGPERERVQASVAELRELDIEQDLPDISESQEALGAYLDRRHRLSPNGGGNQREQSQQQGEQ